MTFILEDLKSNILFLTILYMYIHFDPTLPLPLPQELLSFTSGYVLPTLTYDPLSNWGCQHVYRNEVILLNHGQVISSYILKKNDSTL